MDTGIMCEVKSQDVSVWSPWWRCLPQPFPGHAWPRCHVWFSRPWVQAYNSEVLTWVDMQTYVN